MLPVPTAMVIPVEISEAAFLATTSIVSSKLVEEEDDEEVASPSPLLLFDDDDDDAEKTNPLPLLFRVLFVFAFLLAKNERLICFRQLDDLNEDNEDDEDEEEKEVLVLAERVLGDAKQTLPDILESSVFLFIIIVEKVHFRERKEKKKTNNNDNTRTKQTEEFLQHVLSLSLLVVVVFIVPDMHVQRPGAVLREIRVVFMDETKIVTQMENKTRTPAEETERRRTRESRRVLLARGG
jgi:hypothetical protein